MSILPSGIGQLVLAIAAPFILPRLISTGTRITHDWLNPTPKGSTTRTPLSSTNSSKRHFIIPTDSNSTALWRLILLSSSLSITLLTVFLPPHNLFLSLSPPRTIAQQFLPALRAPLDIRIATDSLARAWQQRLGGRNLINNEMALLNRLQTLDARLIYVAYGTTPLMNCTWCRPPGSTGGIINWDYLVMITPGLALEYLVVLAVVASLLSGHRRHWRGWTTLALLMAGTVELAIRLNWQGTRGGPVFMVNSILHLYRHVACSSLLLVAYFLPPRPIPQHPSSAHLIGPVLADLIKRQELVLDKLRVAKFQRMSVMQDKQSADTARNFWSRAADESRIARADPAIREFLAKAPTRSENNGDNDDEDDDRPETLKAVDAFRELTETAFVLKTKSPNKPPSGSRQGKENLGDE